MWIHQFLVIGAHCGIGGAWSAVGCRKVTASDGVTIKKNIVTQGLDLKQIYSKAACSSHAIGGSLT